MEDSARKQTQQKRSKKRQAPLPPVSIDLDKVAETSQTKVKLQQEQSCRKIDPPLDPRSSQQR